MREDACSTRGHTPQDHKPHKLPPKVEEEFPCAYPALTHTRAHTHNDSPSGGPARKVHGEVEVAVAVEVDAHGTESNATEEED